MKKVRKKESNYGMIMTRLGAYALDLNESIIIQMT